MMIFLMFFLPIPQRGEKTKPKQKGLMSTYWEWHRSKQRRDLLTQKSLQLLITKGDTVSDGSRQEGCEMYFYEAFHALNSYWAGAILKHTWNPNYRFIFTKLSDLEGL